jgi:hypothetical protein
VVALHDRLRRCLAAVTAALVLGLGAATAGAVVGGEPANPAAWPFVVALLDARNPDAFQGQFCAGTLVRSDWVVTAAHCVDEGPPQIEVAGGITDLTRIGPADRVPVGLTGVYPGYRELANGGAENDLAVLHLSRPLPLQPAPLPLAQLPDNLRALEGWVPGWGGLDSGGRLFPQALLTGRVAVSSPARARRWPIRAARSAPRSPTPSSPRRARETAAARS